MVNVLNQSHGDNYSIYNADCCEALGGMPSDSLHYSIYSPPFASLYTYSNSDRDLGNSTDYEQFAEHYRFVVAELFRITMPGRLTSVHCMNLPTTKEHHGIIGIQNFRDDIVRTHQDRGWVFHSEVAIWKDPVTAMQRTKALGLLHKQMLKDSCRSRQGIPDYVLTFFKPYGDCFVPGDMWTVISRFIADVIPSSVLTFRKDGDNPEPVSGPLSSWVGDDSFQSTGNMSIDLWQRYASPIWMDINPSRTLQYTTAREENDDRHICPLQLDVIERCLELWSNPGDRILTPFMGVGSEVHCAILAGRKALGFELKESYYKHAVMNAAAAEKSLTTRQKTLF